MAMSHRNAFLFSAGALGTGAALMYFFDPDHGARRRAVVRDKSYRLVHDTNRWLGKASRDLGNRARGLVAETRSLADTNSPRDDAVLAERIRAKLGRLISHPASVNVAVDGGVVTLRGDVLQSEVQDLLTHIRGMRGVTDVRNKVRSHPSGTNFPGLQGRAGESQHPGLLHNLLKPSPGAKLVLSAAGSALALFGARNSGTPVGRTLGMAGLGLLATQFSNARYINGAPRRT